MVIQVGPTSNDSCPREQKRRAREERRWLCERGAESRAQPAQESGAKNPGEAREGTRLGFRGARPCRPLALDFSLQDCGDWHVLLEAKPVVLHRAANLTWALRSTHVNKTREPASPSCP